LCKILLDSFFGFFKSFALLFLFQSKRCQSGKDGLFHLFLSELFATYSLVCAVQANHEANGGRKTIHVVIKYLSRNPKQDYYTE
jgi:hypothetical protein